MITKEFKEAAAEVVEILKYLPKSEREKIPLKLRTFFQNIADVNYIVKIDPSKSLDQQELQNKTKDVITVIYRNYWCNEEQRKELDKKLIENDKKYEEELKKKYDPENIFKMKKTEYSTDNKNNYSLIEVKEKTFIQKIIDKIKKIFKI